MNSNKQADKRRTEAIEFSKTVGPSAAAEALNMDHVPKQDVMLKALKSAHFNKDDRQLRELDLSMKDKTDRIQNDISRFVNNLNIYFNTSAKKWGTNQFDISSYK